MATTNPSLFGMLGDEAAMQRQLDEQRAAKFAEQTQEQRLASMGYSAGAGLGRGIAGAFGVDVTDPVVRQATQLRQLASEFDTTTPEGMMKFAQAARSISPDVAQKAAQEAQAMQLKSAEITAKTAEKMTNEQRNALALVASAGLDVKTPEGAKAYNEALKGLTAKGETRPQKVGLALGTQQPVYQDGTTQFIYTSGPSGTTIKQPYYGGVDQTTAKVSASAGDKGRTAFEEELAKQDAKKVNAANLVKDNAIATLNSLDQLSKLDNQGLISGAFATGRVGATNLLSTLGLVGENDKAKLASSENYQKVAGDVILGVLGGKLGAGFSNEDRKFIQSLVPQLETSPLARRQLINFMVNKNQKIIDEATRLDEYARENQGLKGYKATIPFVSTEPTNKYSNLTDDELDARIRAAQAKQAPR
jgi:hypothetical protein